MSLFTSVHQIDSFLSLIIDLFYFLMCACVTLGITAKMITSFVAKFDGIDTYLGGYGNGIGGRQKICYGG